MRSRMWVSAGLTALVTTTALTATAVSAAPVDYGPGVALLEAWYHAGTRGDLAGDTNLIEAAEIASREAIEAPDVSLQGEAVVAFIVGTPSGAAAYVVQYATDTRGGQTTVAQGVSLPAGVAIWFDRDGAIIKTIENWPVSQGESATEPDNAQLAVGMWSSKTQKHLLLFDSGYPTHIRDGVLGPKYSSRNDLVRSTERTSIDHGSDGYTLLTPTDRVLRGTARVTFRQPDDLSNHPEVLGGAWDWLDRSGEHGFPLDLDFETLQSTTPLEIWPWPAAYESGREATELARSWTRERMSLRAGLWGSPLQAELPRGHRVLMRNAVFGKAYVALVRFRSGKVVGTRCKTPGPVLTASCRLPRHLGRLFTVDEPFAWRD